MSTRRKHCTCEQLFDAEAALRSAASWYSASNSPETRRQLRAAAREYAAVAIGIDAAAIAPDGPAQ